MNCSKCGCSIQNNEIFCSKCGAVIPKDNTSTMISAEPTISPVITENDISTPQTSMSENSQSQTIQSAPTNTQPTFTPPQPTTIPQQYATAPVREKKSKLWLIILIIGLSLTIIASGLIVIPKLLITPEKLIAKGDYIGAYEIADEQQKDEIVKLNTIAVCSALCKDSLKDSESFNLREAWYREDTYTVILTVAANNSYGNTVINYWYYYWSEDDLQYTLLTSLTSLEEEELYSWDDSDEQLEKSLDNLARITIKSTMTMKNAEIDKEDIKVINNLSEQGILESVELIDIYRNSSPES